MIFPNVAAGNAFLRLINPVSGKEAHGLLRQEGLTGLPSVDVFIGLCGDPGEVVAQFRVETADSGATVGVTSLQRLDLNSGHVQACGLLQGEDGQFDVRAAALALTVNYAFSMWSVRKCYLWTVQNALHDLSPISPIVHKEATLHEFLYDLGTLRDVNIFAIYRDCWTKSGLELLERLDSQNELNELNEE